MTAPDPEPEADVDRAIASLGRALGRLDEAALDQVAARLVVAEHDDPWARLVAGAIAGAIASRRGPGLIAVVEPPVTEPAPDPRERALIALAFAIMARLVALTREAATRLARRGL